MASAAAAAEAASADMPDISHLTSKDFEHIYEPQEDTYLFLDALLDSKEELLAAKPTIALEIGPGSGVVSTYLGTLLGGNIHLLGCDINPAACTASKETAERNGVPLYDTINCDLVTPVLERLQGKLDVLLFNPPYVPTPSEEVGSRDIAAAWAGGVDGREVIDRVLPLIPQLLSKPAGLGFMVLVKENKPNEIASILKSYGLVCSRVRRVKAKNERLMVVKIAWKAAG